MRLSDLLGKHNNQAEKPSSPVTDKLEEKPAKTPEISVKVTGQKPPEQERKKETASHPAEIRNLYDSMILFMFDIVENLKVTDENILRKAKEMNETAINELLKDNERLSVLTMFSTPANLIVSHSVNVCILSIKLGIGLGYSKDRLVFLGISALLHEIGKMNIEQAELSERVKENRGFVARIKEQLQKYGILNDSINEKELEKISMVIRLLNFFETETHPDKLKEAKLPFDVIKMLVGSTDADFDHSLIKKLIEELSIYPPGSFVHLGTGEIGMVVGVNRKFPTRPVVEILIDREKKFVDPPRVINLVENPMAQIKEALNKNKINTEDRRFLQKLKVMEIWEK